MLPQLLARRLLEVSIACSTMLFFAILTGCSGDSESSRKQSDQQLVPAVEAVQARYGSLPLTERMNGLVRAKNQVELYPQVSAAVMEVYVNNGDFVNAGAPLVRLRDTELREQLKQAEASHQIAVAQARQAEAELRRVRTELERSTSLAKQNLISDTEFESIQTRAVAAEADADLARARVQQAQATIDERREALSFTVIRAPVDGTVGNRNAEVGMVVGSNTELFTIGQLDTVRVEVILTDRMLSYIKEGQRAEVTSPDAPLGILDAPVARISPFLHPVSHSTKAEIDLANPDGVLKPGMFVTVDVYYGESQQTTLVPLSALWENPATASTGVYVSHDSLTSEPVTMLNGSPGGGLSNPVSFDFVPVEVVAQGRMSAGVSGINPGSWVVTIGHDLLDEDSARARVRQVSWERVENQQRLQREDLLENIIQHQQSETDDTELPGTAPARGGQ